MEFAKRDSDPEAGAARAEVLRWPPSYWHSAERERERERERNVDLFAKFESGFVSFKAPSVFTPPSPCRGLFHSRHPACTLFGLPSLSRGIGTHTQTHTTQVYECVLRACVEVNDGQTALQVLRRQAAEPERLQNAPPPPRSSDPLIAGEGRRTEVSGGPPDRRCWSLAAEALGRAGMVEEVRYVVVVVVVVVLFDLHLQRG